MKTLRAYSFVGIAIFAVAGCVTVVAPTPLSVTSHGTAPAPGKVVNGSSETFTLPAGDYATAWTTQPSGCGFTLVLGNTNYTYATQLTPTAAGVAEASAAPMSLAADTYRWTWSTLCDSWTATVTRIR